MNLLLLIIKRFLSSNRKIGIVSTVSKITISGIALGTSVVILALTILDGFEKVVSDKINEFNAQIKVTGFGNRNLPEAEFVQQKINEVFTKEISSVDPFSSKLAIIKSKNNTDGINLTGVKTDFAAKSFTKFLAEGEIFSNQESEKEILVGKNLALKMGINLKDKITIFCLKGNAPPSLENPPAIEQYLVSGIYETGISEYDDGNAFINLIEAQNLFGMSNEVSGYNITIKDHSELNSITNKLQDFLGYPFYARTIFQVHQNIFTWIELQKKPIPIVLGLIIIVALFNIVGTMLMIVLEKTNSIGVLRSLGTKRSFVLKIFLGNSLYLILWGLSIGILLSLVLSILQKEFNIIALPGGVYFVTSVPISINFWNYFFVAVITISTAFFSSLIPAYVAAKISPTKALRFE
ncbi:MAG: Lipoprotein-releasing system permease protein [Ignavibacteria bacterium]|nr:MAG: Lipoprotein-releasing system permease protein [Ignavibacteria bacterium]KAF0161133.1 MAG: Lipoprotein-releasing system permease protein [Ignavibacteria bacterium]